MRARVVLGFVLWSGSALAAGNAPLPNPEACGNYQHIVSGTADADCEAAIASESDPRAKSMLLFRRAYIKVTPGDFNRYQSALDDLVLALKLFPDNWAAHHERAYIYNEYGRWKDAAEDLDAEIALAPESANGYRERALSRFELGDLQGTYDDRDAAIAHGDSGAQAYLARARAAMWLGKFDRARADIQTARDMAGRVSDQEATAAADDLSGELTLWATNSGSGAAAACDEAGKMGAFDRKTLIGDCTRAFLDATTPKGKADALTVRGSVWIAMRNKNNQIRDEQIAAALDPSAGPLSNLAFSYVNDRHSTAAMPLFDRSIALDPAFYNYAGRSIAKLNLGDLDGAEADARKSNGYKPNEIAFTVLGDIAYARTKSYDRAAKYWIAAYNLGDRDDGLTARLKDAGVSLPPPPTDPDLH